MSPLFHYSFILCLLVLVSHNIWHRRSLSYLPNPTLPSIIPTPFKSLFPSVSLNGITFLAKECQSLTQLPYQPANNPQALFAPHSMPTFILASSHRLHASAFAVVGLGTPLHPARHANAHLRPVPPPACVDVSLSQLKIPPPSPFSPLSSPALFAPHGMPTFIFASSHRLHASAFAVVGLGARAGRYLWGSREETCLWISLEGPRAITVSTGGSIHPSAPHYTAPHRKGAGCCAGRAGREVPAGEQRGDVPVDLP
ncbi:unnamed protein product [Closterium sp. Naga37s-1]|nr:unnamed protein product [Closterium sp. Naga37s-1]